VQKPTKAHWALADEAPLSAIQIKTNSNKTVLAKALRRLQNYQKTNFKLEQRVSAAQN
jgi:hypothetical protein